MTTLRYLDDIDTQFDFNLSLIYFNSKTKQMDMKITQSHLFKSLVCIAVILFGTATSFALTVTHDGIRYTTSGVKATITTPVSGVPYTGEVVIPETFTEGGVTYTVIATGANAFKGCTEVTKVTLPATCVTIARNTFSGCTGLTNWPIPSTATSIGNGAFLDCTSLTEATIPASVTSKIVSDQFSGCTALKKLIIADSDEALDIDAAAFAGTTPPQIEELYLGRNIGTLYVFPFKNYKFLKSVTIGPKVTSLPSETFRNDVALQSVSFDAKSTIQTLPSNMFENCTVLASVALPTTLTSLSPSLFYGCSVLTSVTNIDNITSIGTYAFGKCTALKSFNIPANVESIGSGAFNNSGLEGAVTIPAKVTAIGSQAYALTKITSVAIPSGVTSIGSAAFAKIATLSSITVDPANTTYKTVKDALYSADGKNLFVIANQSANVLGQEKFEDAAVETLDNYALWATPYKTVSLPVLKTIGTYAMSSMPNIESFTITKDMAVGTYAFANSGLKSIAFEEGYRMIIQGTAMNNINLTQVTIPSSITSISKDAFAGCTALKTMNLGKNVNYLEGGSIPTTIETIRCENQNVPAIAPDLFTTEQSAVVCKVAESVVADYKAVTGWNYLNIVGDATITGAKAALGCPTGIYFATKDGKVMYYNENKEVIDTKIASGAHALQLGAFKNRVYIASAGDKFTYQSPAATQGDGETFYINKSGDNFYRVTVLNNYGYNAFEDPFSITILPKDEKILLADRNVGIHEISTEAVGLFGSQDFFLQNNQLSYYGAGITYGAIGCGIFLDSEGTFWMGKKFNGEGLFRFKKEDIGNTSVTPQPIIFQGMIMTTFYIDEANGYVYLYLQKNTTSDPAPLGLYRVALSDIKTLQNGAKISTIGKLIDNSPVLQEGIAPSELTGITQITGDGDHIYWAYIAPETATDLAIGDVPFDAANPLHKSGIKTIPARGEDLTVTFAVPDVKAYGVVSATYNAPTGVTTITNGKAGNHCIVKGSEVIIPDAARVRIVSVSGAILNETQVVAGGSISVQGLEKGLYLVQVAYANGGEEVVKVIR